jgi:hypothetical protein
VVSIHSDPNKYDMLTCAPLERFIKVLHLAWGSVERTSVRDTADRRRSTDRIMRTGVTLLL